jgi:hypothetical protein
VRFPLLLREKRILQRLMMILPLAALLPRGDLPSAPEFFSRILPRSCGEEQLRECEKTTFSLSSFLALHLTDHISGMPHPLSNAFSLYKF